MRRKGLSENTEALPAPLNYGAIPRPNYRPAFPRSICTSINEVVCHGIPSAQTLEPGDIVNVDVTTILNGYYGDTGRMFFIEPISERARKLLDVAKKCLNIGIGQVRHGNRFGNIGYEINRYATSQGCSVVYEFCGHGVGLKFHEDPQVPYIAAKHSGPVMKAGMIFTIEPMINEGVAKCIVDENDHWTARTADNLLSAQYEHTVLVTRRGAEILTRLEN